MPEDESFAGLSDPKVGAALDAVHRAARGDKWIFLRALPHGLAALARGRGFMSGIEPQLADAYIGVPDPVGRLLYLTARAIGARRAVEFGTSFGISALYLAAAMRANGGRFIGTERERHKVVAARRNLERAGLTAWAEVREGDARDTLRDLDQPIDLLLMDGWKDLYLPLLQQLMPALRPGAVVIADNIHTFRKALAPYVAFVQSPASGFESTTLPLGAGIEYSVYRPAAA